MATSRYSGDSRIDLGRQFGTNKSLATIRSAVKRGILRPRQQIITTGADRLDTIAGSVYGDGRYWWVLAAASDIGWGMQVPPDTVINVLELADVLVFI